MKEKARKGGRVGGRQEGRRKEIKGRRGREMEGQERKVR